MTRLTTPPAFYPRVYGLLQKASHAPIGSTEHSTATALAFACDSYAIGLHDAAEWLRSKGDADYADALLEQFLPKDRIDAGRAALKEEEGRTP